MGTLEGIDLERKKTFAPENLDLFWIRRTAEESRLGYWEASMRNSELHLF